MTHEEKFYKYLMDNFDTENNYYPETLKRRAKKLALIAQEGQEVIAEGKLVKGFLGKSFYLKIKDSPEWTINLDFAEVSEKGVGKKVKLILEVQE